MINRSTRIISEPTDITNDQIFTECSDSSFVSACNHYKNQQEKPAGKPWALVTIATLCWYLIELYGCVSTLLRDHCWINTIASKAFHSLVIHLPL